MFPCGCRERERRKKKTKKKISAARLSLQTGSTIWMCVLCVCASPLPRFRDSFVSEIWLPLSEFSSFCSSGHPTVMISGLFFFLQASSQRGTLSVAVHSWEVNADLLIYCKLEIGFCFLYCRRLTAPLSGDHTVVPPIMQLIRCADYVDEATCHSNLHKSHNPTPTSAQTHYCWSKCHRQKRPNFSSAHPSTHARLVHVVRLSM